MLALISGILYYHANSQEQTNIINMAEVMAWLYHRHMKKEFSPTAHINRFGGYSLAPLALEVASILEPFLSSNPQC